MWIIYEYFWITSLSTNDSNVLPTLKFTELRNPTQQDYYNPQNSTLVHIYYTGTYTKVTTLLLWSISAVTR